MCSLLISIFNIYLILFLHSTEGQRRVSNGRRVNKSYVVYFLQDTDPDETEWTCGGAIIHPRFVLTNDVCTNYNSNLWVIPGYSRLISRKDMAKDTCTSKFRIRVTYVCRLRGWCKPPAPQKTFYNIEIWANQSVAVCQLETRIDYYDESYLQYCSYKPTQIKLTYRAQSYAPGVDAIVYGWGSHRFYRPINSSMVLNSRHLMGTRVKMMNATECRDIYQNSHPEEFFFRRETICSQGMGNVDEDGNFLGATRRNNSIENDTLENQWLATRRQYGPCQNDQGSPLVTWMGGMEYMIGVVNAFFVNEEMECLGPYLYLGVANFAKFINCSLSQRSTRRNNPSCEEFDLPNLETDDIDWDADLKSLYFDNNTHQQHEDFWQYSDEA